MTNKVPTPLHISWSHVLVPVIRVSAAIHNYFVFLQIALDTKFMCPGSHLSISLWQGGTVWNVISMSQKQLEFDYWSTSVFVIFEEILKTDGRSVPQPIPSSCQLHVTYPPVLHILITCVLVNSGYIKNFICYIFYLDISLQHTWKCRW